eukprot:8188282-Ditylum_brightwellii.AAC.1
MRESINNLTVALRDRLAGIERLAGIGRSHTPHYCWSHGVTGRPHHIRSNCCWQKEGHQVMAMFSNKMGESKTRSRRHS